MMSRFLNAWNRTTIAALASLMISVGGVAFGGSIWSKGNAPKAALCSDTSARVKGDNLTVIINEQTQISNDTNRNTEKKTSHSLTASGNVSAGNLMHSSTKPSTTHDLASIDASTASDDKFDGTAKYGSNRSMTDSVTLTVEDVLPNGNLVLLGTRERTVDGDQQIIQISGIVRPSDVNFDNTVSSDRVADFRIVFKSKGQERTQVNPGWLTSIWNIANPN
jgi:flagellar L-ring protein precursor FlgH